MRSRSLLSVALLCAFPALALAQIPGFEADYDDEKKPWKEIEAQIPPYPKSENLILFETAPAGHQFFIDAPSVSVGTEGVVRSTYPLVVPGVNAEVEGLEARFEGGRIVDVRVDGDGEEVIRAQFATD